VILKSEDKMRGRLQAIRYVLEQFDYDDKDLSTVIPLDPLLIAPVPELKRFGDD